MLTSLAETLSEGRASLKIHRDEALHLFREALELFQRCLNVQEFKHTQAQENAAQQASSLSDANNPNETTTSSIASIGSEEEVWASVEEPITKDTLLDTAIAQLDTLTAICSLSSSHVQNGLAWVEEYYRSELQDKVNVYLGGSSRLHEAALAKAKFVSAISDAAFRGGRLDLYTYEREMNATFTNQDLDVANDPQALCDRADAHLNLNTSVQDALQQAQSIELTQVGSVCWKHITKALDSLTAASRLPDALTLPRIHIRRGDCELLRLHLGEAPLKYDLAIKSAHTLLKNAEVYFRGAAALARRNGDAEEELTEAEVKEAIAMALADGSEKLVSLLRLQRDFVMVTVEEMREEGVLGEESVQKIGRLLT